MPKTFSRTVLFAAPPETLFALYPDARLHAEATGAGASIEPKAGKAFTAWDGYIGGVNLHVVKDRMVVQTWRGSDWKAADPDSILVLLFLPEGRAKGGARGGATRLHVTHANVPDDQFEGVRDGWTEFYWRPWKAWLKREAAASPRGSSGRSSRGSRGPRA
jgi:activator of HSP90 ATPase